MVKLSEAHISLICREAKKGWVSHTPQTLARNWGVSDRRVRQIAQQYRESGEIPKLNPNRRPKSPPLTPEEKQWIDEAWQQTQRGARKTWLYLRRKGIRIPKHKIDTHFRASGYSKPNPRKQKKRKRCRYEREHSGSLIHGDWHRTSENHPYLIAWIDDASRKVLSAGEFDAISAESSIKIFDEALAHAAEWGLMIRQVNTDRGSEFYTNAQRGKKQGISQFTIHVRSRGVEHVPSKARNPQTNGKCERLWLEYDRHRWRFETLQEFIDWYNDQVHDELWIDDKIGIYEVPEEAFIRKLPQETLLGLHLRLSQTQMEVAA